MTDSLDAIRARHVAYHALVPDTMRWCELDKQPWPCDTAIVLAALDAHRERCHDNGPDSTIAFLHERLDAALARERRLREALDKADARTLHVGGHPSYIHGWRDAIEMARAALAALEAAT